MNPSPFYVTGGTLALDAPSYVERRADRDLLDALRAGEFCYVLTSRQMGKSSLMVRAAQTLREEGARVAVLDLTQIGSHVTPEQWYDGLLLKLGQALDREDELEDFWLDHPRLGPLQRFMAALGEVILPSLTTETRRHGEGTERIGEGSSASPAASDMRTVGKPENSPLPANPTSESSPCLRVSVVNPQLVIFIDEIDFTRSLPFSADEFFAAIRECYNRRAQDPRYAQLTFCLLGVATPSDLIRDTRTTPFNIGRRIELTDFTEGEALPLAQGLLPANPGKAVPTGASQRPTPEAQRLLQRVLYWTGGHPYLTQRLCSAIAQGNAAAVAADGRPGIPNSAIRTPHSVDRLCEELFLSTRARERDDNLLFVRERLLRSEADLAGLLDLYRQVRERTRVRDDDASSLVGVLRLAGVVRVLDGVLWVRNRIYYRVFDREWVLANLPDAEVRRQRSAFRAGVLRTATVAGAVVAVMAGLTGYAAVQTGRAVREARRSEGLAYYANLNLIQREWESSNLEHSTGLLEATRRSPSRGWEWGYWDRLHHLDLVAMKGHTSDVMSVAFSPDGRLATGSEDGTARLWDAATGRELLSLKGLKRSVQSVAFSPDGTRLATGGRHRTARLWDAANGRELLALKGHSGWVNAVAFSPDGRRLATVSDDGTARLWDAATGRETLSLKVHTRQVMSVAFSPDGGRLATGSVDGTARLWDAATGRELLSLKGHTRQVMSVAFSPDGRRLATGSGDGTARLWDAGIGRELLSLKDHTDRFPFPVNSVVFSPEGTRLATGASTARLWDAATGRVLLALKGRTGPVISVAFSPEGTRLVTGGEDGTVRLWDAGTGREFLSLKGHSGEIWSVAFSPDGRRLVTGGADGTARLWDAATGRETLSLKVHSLGVREVTFSPDGRRLATGGDDDTARIWDAATGSWYGTVRIWDTATGRELLSLEGPTAAVSPVAFSPDGRRLATGSDDGTARIWDAATGRELLSLRGHTGRVRSVAFSPRGGRLATGSGDGTARLWDAATGRELLSLKVHTAAVSSVAFSPDGGRLATATAGGTVNIYFGERTSSLAVPNLGDPVSAGRR